MPPIALRREDKNQWERRTPLTPDHVAELSREHGVDVRVEPSPIRVFADHEYLGAGAEVSSDLSGCRVIIGVKEIPVSRVDRARTYVCFSHVIKGQASSMPLLQRMLDQQCTLIDYEPIVDDRGRRLIFFGRHAGYAGMLDTLWALGQRLAHEGFRTPFEDLQPALHYASLSDALDHVARIGERIRHAGLPTGLRPVAFGFTGSGNVAQGAHEVFERLPFETVSPAELLSLPEDRDRSRHVVFRTDFARDQRVARTETGGFDAAEFASNPGAYSSALGQYLPHLTVFVNCIYWDPGQPRAITIDEVRRLWETSAQPKLRVIGDITCDVGGSIEVNLRATDSGDPIYVYDVATGAAVSGAAGRGPVVMAVDNLPCELPREASEHFGDSFLRYVPKLARCNWDVPFEQLDLPAEIKRAVITHRGELTPAYRHLDAALGHR